MTESRAEFLARVDQTNNPYGKALFIAIHHLEIIAEGTGNAQRLARQCLQSIDSRLLDR